MKKSKGIFSPQQLEFYNGMLQDENQRLRKELGESKATIRFLLKAASTIEEERDKLEKIASDDVPF